MAMAAVLRRMDRLDITAHGFRSTFRDGAGESATFPNHVVKMATALLAITGFLIWLRKGRARKRRAITDTNVDRPVLYLRK
jgi:hypothetical protein